jgi:uncharacterized protein (DUF2147 family)
MSLVFQRSRLALAGLTAAVAFAVAAFTPVAVTAAELTGAWSGGGSVSLASGAKEKARCRANYSKAGGASYVMSATCATASAKVAQTAQLRKSGANSYSGKFFNPEYGVTGSIRVTVNGKRQSVYLSGDAGSAAFSLRKM